MTLTLTISAKEHSQGINLPPRKIFIENGKLNNNTMENSAHFLGKMLQKEVSQGSRKSQLSKIKKLKTIQKTFLSMLGAYMLTHPVSVSAQTQEQHNPLTTSTGEEITPDIITAWGFKIALLAVGIGVAISGTLLATAGVYRMFRKRKEAEEWTTDIIKGLVQVLIAIPTVYALFHLSQIVFKNLPVLEGLP